MSGSVVRPWRNLRICVAIGGLVPVGAGMAGIWLGPRLASGVADAAVPLDSHFRYLSGLLLAIGLGFWSTLPDIARAGARFRLLTALVFVGGVGRLVSLLTVGTPDAPMLFGLAMELLVTPALALWQGWIAAKLAAPPDRTI